MMEKVLLKYVEEKNSHTYDFYIKHGGYSAAKKALKQKPAEVIDFVKQSNLRGRGGAGFFTGQKWSFVPATSEKPKYLCCNADESEPGTFKDRVILSKDPHQLLEGIVIAAYAIGANTCYIYIRGEYAREAQILERAIQEAYKNKIFGKGILGSKFDLEVYVHRGAGAYICGEESALLNSIEGKRGEPRNKPPFPAIAGLYSGPTVVNNVETLACLVHIYDRGIEWFKGIGPEKSPGPKLFCISGHVKKPGVYELPLGTTLRELIYTHAGGILNDKKLKAVFPGGSSSPILTADEIDIKMDFDSVMAAGSMLGSAGIIVISEEISMVKVAERLIHFYHHESCGQCTPCREGTEWMDEIISRILKGDGREDDLPTLERLFPNIEGKTICAFGEAFVWPVRSMVRKFKQEFLDYVHKKNLVKIN